jgi:hypothetical protein
MSGHVEFPELTPEARAAFVRGYEANGLYIYCISTPAKADRARFAAFLVEAMSRAQTAGVGGSAWQELAAIAANLHSLPPPPPTLAEARAADLDTPAGRDVIRGFLATLRGGEQL